ncbi:MAG: molybdopterin converting factor subunit 1 [Rickettsiales bacterium]|jgi:molybdopterin synthase sulfur carrier subunit|nr:molybdopterin converting factor subunit 1 [Rickettsiales bacterium]MCH2676664.1 molybdopterin converting factor subunit 1 [Alphaproteobacteria bacterium]MEC7834920.1 molybdopterin converting factor subunit 1 [Pseudomonadota bacterium]MEC8875817.1 molybdopterin converting factor subunit 1 [Pseudomonadota bacterium]MEC8877260.1 molybdopterin converting factor subunit 1 [Pseudomonadota bacterium]|tara:strand:+ start:324 stop:575 length:252 start_codon:yes stop_codon:yes gene_type:complete
MKILYFSWIRTKIGKDKEVVILPKNVKNGSDLVDFLKTKGPKHADALKNKKVIRMAINFEHTALNHPIKKNDEIALFPPVTGG